MAFLVFCYQFLAQSLFCLIWVWLLPLSFGFYLLEYLFMSLHSESSCVFQAEMVSKDLLLSSSWLPSPCFVFHCFFVPSFLPTFVNWCGFPLWYTLSSPFFIFHEFTIDFCFMVSMRLTIKHLIDKTVHFMLRATNLHLPVKTPPFYSALFMFLMMWLFLCWVFINKS